MDLLTPSGVFASIVIGLVAGVVGGLAGIGGSIIMLPALALWFGYKTEGRDEHHLYMAAAMCVNAVVAFFSSRKHAEVGAVHKPTTRVLLPAMCLAIIAGVLVSDQFDGRIAKLGLVVFILGYSVYSAWTANHKHREQPSDTTSRHAVRLSLIAGFTGFAAGFLGIGGGILLVPLLQVVGKVPLRRAIAASASVMWVSSIIGSSLKLYRLESHGLDWLDALALASLMAIGAVLGARIGATWTHKLKLKHLKLTIAVILGATAIRMGISSYEDFRNGGQPDLSVHSEDQDADLKSDQDSAPPDPIGASPEPGGG